MEILTPLNWKNYQLLDCGNFLKLEKFGDYITIRPEPQAVWKPIWSLDEWKKKAHVEFVSKSSSSGTWNKLKSMPDQWNIKYHFENDKSITFRLGLTSFKHTGIFPEQAVNWETISNYFSTKKIPQPKFLNLFAYTGGASLAAKLAGCDVTHVDSIKQVVTWANENQQLSNLDGIRWVVEDALKFVKREVRRGSKYHGIILDPPAFGHGANGEKWKLEDNIQEMISEVLQLLNPKEHLLILNAYSLGFSALIPQNLLSLFAVANNSKLTVGELYLEAQSNVVLPLGVWGKLEK